jgi:hypothetical protein
VKTHNLATIEVGPYNRMLKRKINEISLQRGSEKNLYHTLVFANIITGLGQNFTNDANLHVK